VVRRAFGTLLYRGADDADGPEVVYPCIALGWQHRTVPQGAAEPSAPRAAAPSSPAPPAPQVFLSLNRFERKKDLALALRAFARLLHGAPATRPLHLVLAGGYDPRLRENVEHYRELQRLAVQLGLTGRRTQDGAEALSDEAVAREFVSWNGGPSACPCPFPLPAAQPPPAAYAQVDAAAHVTFVRSLTDAQVKSLLLTATAVVYTPSNEHFGIVPLEAMAAFRPVVACASGGPLESVADGETGFLCPPTPEAFADAMLRLVSDAHPGAALRMGDRGAARVRQRFSREALGLRLETVLTDMRGQVGAAGETTHRKKAA
jgi:alpha-1,3/alpha-1,6-mannosyltransferase